MADRSWQGGVVLGVNDHSRDSAGLTYVYPVISRRSGGLSIGVNLNPNNACNWRCVYCQVPGLTRGAPPPIDLGLLRAELGQVLDDALHGDFYRRLGVPLEHRVIRDIAISGNGEATMAREFAEVVDLIGEIVGRFDRVERIKLVLISNGSQTHRDEVQRGLRLWAGLGGEMWFKLDTATTDGLARINGINSTSALSMSRLQAAASVCPVWLQTCLFAMDGAPPPDSEREAYLKFVEDALGREVQLQGVLLYGLARPSLQPEAHRLSKLPEVWLEAFGDDIRKLGLPVRVSL